MFNTLSAPTVKDICEDDCPSCRAESTAVIVSYKLLKMSNINNKEPYDNMYTNQIKCFGICNKTSEFYQKIV